MMKSGTRFIFASAVIFAGLIFAFQANAQRIELAPLIGYETSAKASTENGYLYLGGGMNFGGSVDVGVGAGRYAEISYTHLASHLEYQDARICDLAVDYYSLGFLQEMIPNAMLTPYGMFTMGWVNYRPTTADISGTSRMHLSFALGAKIFASERLGLRLQTRLLLPIYNGGTYFSSGTSGTGYAMAGGVRGVQGDFTASLIVRIK